MSPPWVVAGLVLTGLVVALTVVVVRLLPLVTTLDRTITQLRREVALLRKAQVTALVEQDVDLPGAAEVLVLLEPDLAAARSLALDIRSVGSLEVGIPVRVLVSDSDEGRLLADDLPVGVEFERRQGSVSPSTPTVLVLGSGGRVMAKGSPSSVSELEELVGSVTQ